MSVQKTVSQKKKPYMDFIYVIKPETGNLICERKHRMTNNRIFGWDKNGKFIILNFIKHLSNEY